MTTWTDWRSWTYFVIGKDLASGGRILDLDFANRRLTYMRDTGNDYAECPHRYGTEEYDRYLYEKVEGQFDHVWVNPKKSVVLEHDEYEAVHALRKPASFIELTDVDPRDYFGTEVIVTSTYAPHLLGLILPAGAHTESRDADPKPRDSQTALEEFRQLQRDIEQGQWTQTEAVWQSIWHLGAINDLAAAWTELRPSIGLEVRATLRKELADQKSGDGPLRNAAVTAALSRVAAWAEESGILARDPAFQFMSQPPELILEFVRLHMGEALPDPGMSWFGLAQDAFQNAGASAESRAWLDIAIEVHAWLAEQKPKVEQSISRQSEMYARAHRLLHASTSQAERDLDRQVILEWFFRHESIAPSQAAVCPRDSLRQSVDERKRQARIARMLGVFEMLVERGEPVPDRIREWLALVPYMRYG